MLIPMDGQTYKSGGALTCEQRGGIVSKNTGECNLDFKPTPLRAGDVRTGDKITPISTRTRNNGNDNDISNTDTDNDIYPPPPDIELTPKEIDRINESGNGVGNDIKDEVKKAAINMPFIIIAGIIAGLILGKK